MQGYRGGNRHSGLITPLWRSKLYLIGLWLTCMAGTGMAQQKNQAELPWYVPQRASPSRYMGSSNVVEYSSMQDLAEKLANRSDKPYYLSIRLDNSTAEYWQQLRSLPAATGLAVELADSLMSDTLVQIIANWSELKRIDITGLTSPRSFTVVTNAKGEKVFGLSVSTKRLAATGWSKLRSVQEVLITNEINISQAVSVLQELPALESLTIQQFMGKPTQDVPVTFTGLRRLRKLTIAGGDASWDYKKTFSGLPNLEELIISDPNIRELNAGLPFLTKLNRLQVTVFGQLEMLSKLRLGSLTNLQTLYLMSTRTQSPILLDSTLAGLTTLQRVSIDQIKLKEFPKSLFANRGLTYLSMPDADLGTLPNEIGQLAALQELILDNNPLHRLPDAICQLRQLRRLSVSRCELDALPAAIGQLTSLTSLVLTTNQLAGLPTSVGQLKQLRELNVAMNQLSALPDELGTLPNLQIIAAFWNKITRFPVGFPQLRDLYLSDNQLTELPARLGTSKRLRTLLIENNLITALPDNIGQLDSLETLGIGGNQLTRLPPSIGSLRRLTRLDLGMNRIRVLPETIGGLTSLTSVSLKDLPISQLPASIGAWKQVKLALFRLPLLEALPEEIGQWQQLDNLTIESDRLLVLPERLTDCQKLTFLAVTGRRLIGLPESVGKLASLINITLDGRADTLTGQGSGRITVLPATMASCKKLTSLLILNQQQFDGTEAMQLIEGLPGLKYLTFVNCGITELTGIAWKRLHASTVNLSKNRISQLPAAIFDMPSLEQINLSETNLPGPLNQFFFRRSELVLAYRKANE
ncbi:leucine-rich repeat domain-containing protein [uncultured Fibrella sp.]|uniref:leucine-rich repeat domain-containing protein n=1 Tax=uncultured Fibrella sp. TaxID=1284596 RepID=UPI0035C972AD